MEVSDYLRGPVSLRACVNGPGGPPTLANKFRRTISASEFVPPDHWRNGPNSLGHRNTTDRRFGLPYAPSILVFHFLYIYCSTAVKYMATPYLSTVVGELSPEEIERLQERREAVKNYRPPKWKSSFVDKVSGKQIDETMVDHASILSQLPHMCFIILKLK